MRLLAILAASIAAFVPGCGGDTATMKLSKRYFIRAATYDRMNDHIVIIDPNRPRVVTLDPWPETVFAAANGQRTVAEFVAELRSQWGADAPVNLDAQVAEQLTRLVDEGLVKLIDERQELPNYLASPQSSQDPKEMEKQMLVDGFIRRST